MIDLHNINPILDKEFLIENYDSLEYLLEIFGDFLEIMPSEIDAIKASQISNEREDMLKRIHSISSAVGFVGGLNLSERMRHFEADAKQNADFDINSEEANILIDDIYEFIAIIQAEVEKFS